MLLPITGVPRLAQATSIVASDGGSSTWLLTDLHGQSRADHVWHNLVSQNVPVGLQVPITLMQSNTWVGQSVATMP